MKDKSIYRCVLCSGIIDEDESETLSCSVCGASYPTIAGIRVIVLNPTGLILSQAEQVAENPPDGREQFLADLQAKGASLQSIERLDRICAPCFWAFTS